MMNKLALAVVAAFPFALAACPPPEDNPPVDHKIEAVCTEPSEVPCEDASLQKIAMDPNNVTAGAVSDAAVDDHRHAHVDASVGGISNPGWIYTKLGDDGLTRVELTDADSFASMDWDLAFHRFEIRLNSGTGGPSCVTAARTGPTETFDSVTEVDDSLDFHAEQFMSDTCDIIPDGSGFGAPGTVLQNFWEYSDQQCLQMTGIVYVIEKADGHHVKLVVTNFYDDAAQAECQTDGTLAANHQSGQIQFDWAPLD
jgi:hypothetical protein